MNNWPAVDAELLRTLPPVLVAVVRALGFGRAKSFLVKHGGVNVFIPKLRSAGLGLEPEELARLRETLAPHMNAAGRVWMPKPDKLFIRVRDAQIRKDKDRNSISMLAHQNNLSSRHIQNICREGDDRQFDLF
jgi:Mor family transcriptional regulator